MINQQSDKQGGWGVQSKRISAFFDRCWIPNTPEEKEIADSVKEKLLPYFETMAKQYARQAIAQARQLTEEEQRKANSGRKLYQDGYRDGAKALAEELKKELKLVTRKAAQEAWEQLDFDNPVDDIWQVMKDERYYLLNLLESLTLKQYNDES